MRARVVMVDRGSHVLPQSLAHALAQLRRRRFHLVPGEPDAEMPDRRRYPVTLARALLARLPGSPALTEVLAAAPAGTTLAGHTWIGTDHRPRLALDGLGGIWRFALPGRSGTFRTLRELRTPDDLRPTQSRVVEVAPGVVERRHRIPLRYHPGAWLIIAVTAIPNARVRYDACIWHAGRRRTSALWWDEAQRVIELFRDLAASWFWAGPPSEPSAPAVSTPAQAEAPVAEIEEATPHA